METEQPGKPPYNLLLILLLLLLLLPVSCYAQSSGEIGLGSSLTARNNDSWTSPSGEFAFGFQQIGNGGFLLAIWFDKIPEKTIVWSANGENLVQRGSKIHLTYEGEFVLSDPTGKEIWKADSAGTGVSYAAMLDAGNFVLASQNSTILWESFDHPTDTILPNQTLRQDSKLVARFSEKNFSSGRFMFTLQDDGNLVLHTTDFPLDSPNSAYWDSKTVGSGFQLIFNESGYIYLTARNRSILSDVVSTDSVEGFYQRAILEYDGVFRQYLYPKSAASGVPMAWSASSKFIPDNICTAIEADTGSGACGFNSYCTLGEDKRPYCQCPPGYTWFDPLDVTRGCKQNFVQQRCDGGEEESSLFTFSEVTSIDWPLADYEHFKEVTQEWCTEACLADCFCAVAIVHGGECWKKRNPLSNGRYDIGNGRKAMIKRRKDNSTLPPREEGLKKKDHSTSILIGAVLLGSSAFLNFLFLLSIVLFFVRFRRRKVKLLPTSPVMQGTNIQSFTFKELEEATNGFKDELGRGAFAIVYKGIIPHSSGNLIAVKKFERMENDGEHEFEAEVKAIGRTNHKNLVQLLGFCNEGQNRLLVYEFMSNGSLATFLFRKARPNWQKRVHTVLGTARGLLYLHEECSTQIIHCDIKPENILLDDNLTARISDFGIAKLLKTDQTRTMTKIRGTKGYVAPEWFRTVPVTVKVDVYSFGIVLLEIVFCRRNFEPNMKHENQMVLADWAYDCYKEKKLHLLVEKDDEALEDLERVEKFVMIAMWCTQDDPSQRPTMKNVVQMLEGAVEVSVPPDSSSFSSSI